MFHFLLILLSWLYRIKPSVSQSNYVKIDNGLIRSDFENCIPNPNPLRWNPVSIPDEEHDFSEGIKTFCGTGSAASKAGVAVHFYTCTVSMVDKAFSNADGDILIVPQEGNLVVRTELGVLEVEVNSICVVPRGILFSVEVEGPSRGYLCEIYEGHFRIPDLGPIGANGLANERHFQYPVAAFEDRDCDFSVVHKLQGHLFQTQKDHSPFNVVAWHGNYAPFKFNLEDYVVINSVSVEHIDPSIFTVLTCPSATPGTAVLDFAIFPPRWCVQTNTFRPPYYHRNCMSEFMGLIYGKYDAKEGFQPGGASLHNVFTPHGPDRATFEGASNAELTPEYMDATQAFMFESTYIFYVTEWAQNNFLDEDYQNCWDGLENHFRKHQTEE